MKRFLAFGVLMVALGTQAQVVETHGRTEYFIDQSKRIEIPISSVGVNRLVMAKDRILKIVGSEDEYIVEGDANRGHAFITSKVGDKAFATIISEKGVIQDVVFKVDTDVPSTILLKHKSAPRKLEESIVARVQEIFSGSGKMLRRKSLSQKTLQKLPFKPQEALEYLSPVYRYIWLGFADEADVEALKRLSGIIAVARQNNHLILVEKL